MNIAIKTNKEHIRVLERYIKLLEQEDECLDRIIDKSRRRKKSIATKKYCSKVRLDAAKRRLKDEQETS